MQNAVERAMILARNGSLVFELAELDSAHASRAAPPSTERTGVMTRAELKRCERDSITAALRASGGKIFGPDGAAEMLGMRPTTLASRIKKLGLAAKNP
jgi:transcriptional regulator with GAF, ATPase, and Fis domain